MAYVLVSQTVVTLLDTIETKPRNLGWHHTRIISSIIDFIEYVKSFMEINKSFLNKILSLILTSAVLVELPEKKNGG